MRLKLHDNLGCHSWDSEPVSDLRAFQLIISPAHHLTVQMETLKLGWGEGGAGRHIDGLVGRVGHFVSDSASAAAHPTPTPPESRDSDAQVLAETSR